MTVMATLIGDVVGSRRAADRRALHATLEQALARVNRDCSASVPLRITVGDEYQGCFATLGQALRATLRLRLALHPATDVRHGVGWGELTVLADDPRVEDGPGWWTARSAIEAVADAQTRPASRRLRTALHGTAPASVAAVNAALTGRDELLGGLDARSMSVLSGMVGGMSQQQIADDLGISPSAVSQRVRRDGLGAILAIDELLGALP
jgi:hypothetical protein